MESKLHVLIIDDDSVMLNLASEILQDYYAVSCAMSGQDALDLFASNYVPDMILLDIDMPEMDGFAFLSRLKELEDAQDIPIVFVTGRTQKDAELRGITSGAVDYITKPFDRDILLARIHVHLENGRRLRRLSMMEKKAKNGGIDEKRFQKSCEGLTETESKVFRLILLGYTNQEIGQELSYSVGYIKNVAGILYEKKEVNKRNELIKLYLQ